MSGIVPSVDEIASVAEFRAALRAFLRRSERIARQCGLTPQRYLLLLMIKGAKDGSEQSSKDGRVAHLRLTEEGERRLLSSFTELGTERRQLRDAFAHISDFGASAV